MKGLIDRVGICTLQPGGDPFFHLVRAIIAQLISTRAAKSISDRVQTAVGEQGITPGSVLALKQDALRNCGLSWAKTASIRELAALCQRGQLDLHSLGELSDDEVADVLLPLRGIGAWTVQVFLIFCLGRPNVLPVGDLGVRAAMREHYGLEEMPTVKQVRATAQVWHPYCSIAAWYLWRSRSLVPLSV